MFSSASGSGLLLLRFPLLLANSLHIQFVFIVFSRTVNKLKEIKWLFYESIQ